MELFTTLLEVAGAVCVVVACWLLAPTFGLAVLGATLIGAGYLLGRDL
jgi:hypothetical protein